MASPQAIHDSLNENEYLADENWEKVNIWINDQKDEELYIVESTNSFCPLTKLNEHTVTAEDVDRAVHQGYNDANILKSLMCVNNSILLVPQFPDSLGKNMRIRNYIDHLRKLSEGSYGYALTTGIKTADGYLDNLMIVKSPKDPQNDDLLHEYFIGTFGTNSLRSSIPNFAYILGIFRCSPPYIAEDEALTYCQNDDPNNQVYYVLYENVTDSVTLQKFIEDGCTWEDYLSILIQVTLALDLAYVNIDFTHYDLHDGNILVKRLPQPIYVPYPIDDIGTRGYLYTQYIATIIDYGFSHIKYNDKHFGAADLSVGIYPDRSYPLADIFKLLWSTVESASKMQGGVEYSKLSDEELEVRGLLRNPPVFSKAKLLLQYFYPQLDTNRVSNYILDSKWYLPYYSQYDIRPINFFLEAIMVHSPQLVADIITTQPDSSVPVYGCGDSCLTLETAIDKFTESAYQFIDDPYIFYDLVTRYSDNEVISKGNPQILIGNLIADHTIYYNQLADLTSNFSLLGLSVDILSDSQYTAEYRDYINRAVRIIDLVSLLTNIKLIGDKISDLYNYSDTRVDQLPAEYEELISQLKESIAGDIDFIQSLNRRDTMKSYPSSRWYFSNLPILKAAVKLNN